MLLDMLTRQTTDTKTRSVVKTVTWRIVAGLDTFIISFIVTGRFTSAATIIGVEAITKIIWYYLHERGWEHITWGRYTPSWAEHVATIFNNKKQQ
jgi:uncharacterized membrane protein